MSGNKKNRKKVDDESSNFEVERSIATLKQKKQMLKLSSQTQYLNLRVTEWRYTKQARGKGISKEDR